MATHLFMALLKCKNNVVVVSSMFGLLNVRTNDFLLLQFFEIFTSPELKTLLLIKVQVVGFSFNNENYEKR